jgi:hypothetical protein
MLADMLALTHWEKEWQIVSLASHETDRCWDAWRPNATQLFYLDDVFGQTDLHERLGQGSGQTLARFIARVGTTPNKRLIITTRTQILYAAQFRDESIARAGMQARECVVRVSDYGEIHRARLLYNHLYFSSLDRSVVQKFVAHRAYWEIINHPNFTPRVIEQTILNYQLDLSESSLQLRIKSALDRPILLWGPSFRESLGRISQTLLMQLVAFPTRGAPLSILRQTSIEDAAPIDYTRAIRQLEGSWITLRGTLQQAGPATMVAFHDPSCRDFILAFLDSEPDYLMHVIHRVSDAEQLSMVLGYCISYFIDPRDFKRGAQLRYPSLAAMIATSQESVSEIIKRSWRSPLPESPNRSVATILRTIQRADEEFELGLTEWIDTEVFNIGRLQSGDSFSDSHDTGDLLLGLAARDRRPRSKNEIEELKSTCWEWTGAIAEEGEWAHVERFRNWTSIWADKMFLADMTEAFNSHFPKWVDSELELIVDEATDMSAANSALASLRETINAYFEADALADEFSQAERALAAKLDSYEPDTEDIEDVEGAASAFDPEESSFEDHPSPSTEASSRQELTREEIDSMFGQLG